MEKKYKVLLDTNFVLIPYKFKVDVIRELERIIPGKFDLIVTSSIISELKNLGLKGKFGLDFIKKNNIKIEKYPYNGDDAILEYALKNNCILATNDKELKKKAIKKGLPIIYLRKKRILEIGGINV